ncbi:MAG: hypothetical protein LH474_07680, partial [Chamaesiphon sp.]|nr:hypothetical protein [Chamaesiphon sp.]
MNLTNVFARSLQTTQQQLIAFAQQADFLTIIDRSFGAGFHKARLAEIQAQWLAGDFRNLPEIEIVEGSVLGTAPGAYGASTNRIYLSAAFVDSADELAIAGVLTEEIGHWVDSQINVSDTPGDEGQLFSALVWGQDLSAAELSQIQAEDDTKTIFVNGQSVLVEQADIPGTTGNDNLTGTSGDDIFTPLTGVDNIDGGTGTDTLVIDYSGAHAGGIQYVAYNAAGSGSIRALNAAATAFDTVSYSNIEKLNITGTANADDIRGGSGNDIINAGAGDDTLTDGGGVDIIDGGVGDDNITINISSNTGANNIDLNNASNTLANGTELRNIERFNTITTGAGNDTITAKTGSYDDIINSGAGDDTIDAKDGTNTIDSGDGNDTIRTGIGADNITTGAGDDTIFSSAKGADSIDAGVGGTDTLTIDYSGTRAGGIQYVAYNAAGSGSIRALNAAATAFDTVSYSNIEKLNITGTANADDIRGGSGNDIINAGAGDDTLTDGGGVDIIDGG